MSHAQVSLLRKHYREGTRIKIISINDETTKLANGDKGIIRKVDDIGQIHVNWDRGTNLALVYNQDEFITI